MAGFIPSGADVLEFGAGRLVLRDHLPHDCRYQPSDIVDRGGNTIIYDLNKEPIILTHHYSHVVFSGVLEYVVDIGGLLASLKDHYDGIVASYATADILSDYLTRRRNGWLNHLSGQQLQALFLRHGFTLTQTQPWRYQTIYVFSHHR